ncbi:MAG: hypothetical protein JW810_09000 [Sedimentisphaerales bacterium]|nr:hypothetical protein [Sedimentisphaerales bacterium]
MRKSGMIFRSDSKGRFVAAGFLLIGLAGSLAAAAAVWTGLGTTSRWADPNNWQYHLLPGSNDVVGFAAGADWQIRQQTVTIDAPARCGRLEFYHYNWPAEPFHHIRILAPAQMVLASEHIDQNQYAATYVQSGGRHEVGQDLYYTTYNGTFRLSGGQLLVGGTFHAGPDRGHVFFAGGSATLNRLALGYNQYKTTIHIEPAAAIEVTGQVSLEPTETGKILTLAWEAPLFLAGADWINRHQDPRYVQGLEQADLRFSGTTTCRFEVGGGDYGAEEAGFTDNFALGRLQIGDPNGGHVVLTDQRNNCPDTLQAGAEALYVDTLVLGYGSVLDLAGYKVYFRNLIDQGGQYPNGIPQKIGEKYLQLTAPNGGEKWMAGETVTVSWQSGGDVNDVVVEYSLDDGLNWFEVEPPNAGNTGGYAWQVPEVSSSQARIRIRDAVDAGVFDISEDPFYLWIAGSLVGWGRDQQGQIDVPAGKNYVAVAAGGGHSLALKSNGALAAWGANSYGQTTIPGGTAFVAVAAGENFSLALRDDGTVAAWGDNGSGQTLVPGDPNAIVAIAAGGEHALALREDGGLLAWGDNGSGQIDVPAGTDFVAVAAGGMHSLALRADGTVAAWGDNSLGQLDVPEPDPDISRRPAAIAAGLWHSLALRRDGTPVGWGNNSFGQLNLPEGDDFVAIAAGGYHNLALRGDGSIAAWGANNYNQINALAGGGFVALAAGKSHSLAIQTARLTLIEPDGGQAYLAGKTYPVRWQTLGDVAEVQIAYSIDNGQNFSAVEPANQGNTGRYDWLIPPVNSDQCRLRIRDAAAAHIQDTSAEAFTLYQCVLPTDLDGDCLVNLSDLAILLDDWLACGNPFDPDCRLDR